MSAPNSNKKYTPEYGASVMDELRCATLSLINSINFLLRERETTFKENNHKTDGPEEVLNWRLKRSDYWLLDWLDFFNLQRVTGMASLKG
jgi:hypothetical protein